MHVFCMRGSSIGNIRKRSSVGPQTKAVSVGIKLKQTNTILKYFRGDKRYRDVLSENGYIIYNVREGRWLQNILFLHLVTAIFRF